MSDTPLSPSIILVFLIPYLSSFLLFFTHSYSTLLCLTSLFLFLSFLLSFFLSFSLSLSSHSHYPFSYSFSLSLIRSDIDFESLAAGRIIPPWTPTVVGSMDTSQFDMEFTSMLPVGKHRKYSETCFFYLTFSQKIILIKRKIHNDSTLCLTINLTNKNYLYGFFACSIQFLLTYVMHTSVHWTKHLLASLSSMTQLLSIKWWCQGL